MTSPHRDAGDAEPGGGRGSPHLEELTAETCRQLLAEHAVGRVGFHSDGGSVIFPVTYRMVDDTVVFRTSPAGTLAQLRRRTSVAFEVDDIDERARGWSVLVSGHPEVVTNDHRLTQLWQTGPVPWASGTRNLFIAISMESVTGRRIRGPWVD